MSISNFPIHNAVSRENTPQPHRSPTSHPEGLNEKEQRKFTLVCAINIIKPFDTVPGHVLINLTLNTHQSIQTTRNCLQIHSLANMQSLQKKSHRENITSSMAFPQCSVLSSSPFNGFLPDLLTPTQPQPKTSSYADVLAIIT